MEDPQIQPTPRHTAAIAWLLIPIAAIIVAVFVIRWLWTHVPSEPLINDPTERGLAYIAIAIVYAAIKISQKGK